MTHRFVMTSSLPTKIFKIDKFRDFSSDIDYNSRTYIFRDDIFLIMNQCDSRRPKGASGGHKVSASRAAQASEARLFSIKTRLISIYFCNELIEETARHRKLIFGLWESFDYGSSKF